MRMADEYFQRNPEARYKPRIAAEKHGRQNDGKTWVLSEFCQIDEDGDQMDENDSIYIWMGHYLSFKYFASLLKKLKKAVPGMVHV
jgi:hypothetical protein